MLNHITKRDPAPVRTHRHTKLCRHQNDRHHIIHPRHPYGINLTIPNRSSFKKLLKNHRRSRMLTTSKLKRFLFEAFRKLNIPKNIIPCDGFLHPLQSKRPVIRHMFLGFSHSPELISIHHQRLIISNRFPHELKPSHILGRIQSYLHFEGVKSFLLKLTNCC